MATLTAIYRSDGL